MEATSLPACLEHANGDTVVGSASASPSRSGQSPPFVDNVGSDLIPAINSPPATRPTMPHSSSSAFLPSSAAISHPCASAGVELSPPHTPLQGSDAAGKANEQPRPLPPNDISFLPYVASESEVSQSTAVKGLLLKEEGLASSDLPLPLPKISNVNTPFLTAPKDVITPPAEADSSTWEAMQSASSTSGTGSSESLTHSGGSMEAGIRGLTLVSPAAVPGAAELDPGPSAAEPSWFEGIIEVVDCDKEYLRVLSQAFPSPDRRSHVVYRIIDCMHAQKRDSMPYIMLQHAVSADYRLARLPGSSSTTPQDEGANDYFSSKVVSTAIPSSEHQNGPVSPMAAFQRLHLTVVERFIPPTTQREVGDMLSSQPDHYLAHRLEELTHKRGSLVFIHPTKAGAKTFAEQYLGQLLDPILRSMNVRYDLTEGFCAAVGTIASLDAITEFEQMREAIQELCRTLTKAAASREPEKRVRYNIALSKKGYERLATETWVKWWTEQEKRRIEEVVRNHFKITTRIPRGDYGSVPQSTLVSEVLLGLEERAKTFEAKVPIELGVFVIRKSRV